MRVLISISLVLIASVFIQLTSQAPVCHSCTKNCFASTNATDEASNSTLIDNDLLTEIENNEIEDTRSRRTKREVEYRACSRFQIEMLLIPMAIAMIPLVLCALFLCTCCCGPKESQSKLPDDFLASLPMSKKRSVTSTSPSSSLKMATKSEEFELEWGDGYVARKDSSRTKFSTTVSYIEARRESIWSATSVASDTAAETLRQENAKAEKEANGSTGDLAQSTDHPKITKAKSCDSIKRCRFSDTVSVISVDSLNRR